MIGGLAILFLMGIISPLIVSRLKARYPIIDEQLLTWLYYYHMAVAFAYYLYVTFNPSDSKAYYASAFSTDEWFSLYGTSTTFIKFLAFPFIKYISLSYEATMVLFAWFGYLGFVYFYVFFRENIRFKHTIMGFDMLTVFFFLPNLHFWSASLGKGSVIFLGMGLFFFGLSRIRTRYIAILIGGVLIYHIRPHIMLVVLISAATGFMFSSKGISLSWRVVFLCGAAVALFFIYKDVLTLVGIDDDAVVSQGFDLTHRARELSKATSGVDISSYSLPMQVFTFLYRPLFIDAPGALGIFVSAENVFYLVISMLMLWRFKGWLYLFRGTVLTKSAFISFLMVSIALAQISGNLGLAIRQKSQVMILFLFVVISFLDNEKLIQWRALMALKLRRQRQGKSGEGFKESQNNVV